MNFGLGLVLSFTDNASAGINNAVNSLNRLTDVAENAGNSLNEVASLSALSAVAIQVGHSFVNAGGRIMSTLGGIISKVNETGQTLMYAENQLNKLYEDSGKSGKDVLDQLQQYAKTSIFEFEDLIPVVTSLKSVGIEAFDSIATSTGSANQTLMDYAADLAAFNPMMRNAYGTGIQAAMGSIKEYIAEGNAMSLKRGAGIDIKGILGEDKGATIAERSQQIADLIDKLGMVGMTAEMANSPMTKLSNMSDTLFQFLGKVSENGVYDAFNRIIDVFANFVTKLDDTRLQNLASKVGSALSLLLKPIEVLSKVLVFVANGFLRLVETVPFLAQMVVVATALAGVLLVLGGLGLIFMGSVNLMAFAVGGFGKSLTTITGLLKTFGTKSFEALKSFKFSLVGIKKAMATFGGFAMKLLGVFAPLTLKLGLLYLAWKSNFLGIRTNVTYFVNGLTSSFRTARQAVDGSVANLISTLADLKSKDDFFSNLTIGIMKVQMVFKALKDAWGDYTLSEENFLKAKELGILPLIEAILDLKYRVENFVRGFKVGISEVAQAFKTGFDIMKLSLEGTFLEPVLNAITKLFQLITSNDAQAWYDFGRFFAHMTPLILGVAVAFKVLTSVASIITKVSNALGILGGALSKVIGFFGKIVGPIGSAVIAILKLFGVAVAGPPAVVGAITVAVATILALVIAHRDKIFAVLKTIGGWINTNVIQPVKNFFSNLWSNISNGASNFVGSLKTKFKSAVTSIKSFFNPLVGFFRNLWSNIVSLFSSVGTKVGNAIGGAVRSAVNGVLSGAIRIINGFIGAINGAIGFINKIPGVNISRLSKLGVPQLAQGGVVDKPTPAIFGEAGAEAVVPLENNLGWLTKLAGMIVEQMNMIPTNSNNQTGQNNQSSGQYMTNNNSNSNVYEGNTDNSVTFNEGAIQVSVQNASEEEAMNLARKIMEYIKRQNELGNMMTYA